MQGSSETHAPAPILLATNQASTFLALRTALRPLPLSVHQTQSGLEALSLCEEWDYAFLIVDFDLVDLPATAIARRLRGDPLGAPPLMAVAGRELGERELAEGFEAGLLEIFSHPLAADRLRCQAATLLHLHRRKLAAQPSPTAHHRLQAKVAEGQGGTGDSETLMRLGLLGATTSHLVRHCRQPVFSLERVLRNLRETLETGQTTPEFTREQLALADTALARIQRMLEELRDLDHPPPGEGGLFEVEDAVRQTLEMVDKDFANSQIQIRVEEPVPALRARGERSSFVQALFNILVETRASLVTGSSSMGGLLRLHVGDGQGQTVVSVRDNRRHGEPHRRERESIPLLLSGWVIEKKLGGHLLDRVTADGHEWRISLPGA